MADRLRMVPELADAQAKGDADASNEISDICMVAAQEYEQMTEKIKTLDKARFDVELMLDRVCKKNQMLERMVEIALRMDE